MTQALVLLVLAQQAVPSAPPRPPAPPADDGAVLIRLGGQVVDADDAGCANQTYTGTPIDLDVQQAELANVLRLIGTVSHLNFVLDDSVHGTVTVRLEQVPWDLALDAILQSKGLVAVPMGPNLRLIQPMAP